MSTTVRPNDSVSPELSDAAADEVIADASADASADDRRQRTRLRDLCDEVLASYRVAAGSEPLSPDERREAVALLAALLIEAASPARSEATDDRD